MNALQQHTQIKLVIIVRILLIVLKSKYWVWILIQNPLPDMF